MDFYFENKEAKSSFNARNTEPMRLCRADRNTVVFPLHAVVTPKGTPLVS